MSLVNTSWLEENLDKVKIIDCSWHMPQTKRIGFDGQISAALSSAANKTRIKLAQFINFLYIFS